MSDAKSIAVFGLVEALRVSTFLGQSIKQPPRKKTPQENKERNRRVKKRKAQRKARKRGRR